MQKFIRECFLFTSIFNKMRSSVWLYGDPLGAYSWVERRWKWGRGRGCPRLLAFSPPSIWNDALMKVVTAAPNVLLQLSGFCVKSVFTGYVNNAYLQFRSVQTRHSVSPPPTHYVVVIRSTEQHRSESVSVLLPVVSKWSRRSTGKQC